MLCCSKVFFETSQDLCSSGLIENVLFYFWASNKSEESRGKILKRKYKCETGGSLKFPIASVCRGAVSAIAQKVSVSSFGPFVFQLPHKQKTLRKQLVANVLYK